MIDTKQANSLSSALLESINTLSKANTSTGTLTVEAIIREVVDEGLGIYKVQYLQNTFEASSINSEITYNIEDHVYLLIPNGDFDKPKVILAPINNNNMTFTSEQNGNFYLPLGDNLFRFTEINPDNYQEIELSLYSNKNEGPIVVNSIDLTEFNRVIEPTLKDSRTFAFQALVRTELAEEQRKIGNYGINFVIPTYQDGERTEYKVTLDITTMQGDPYNFKQFSEQTLYFTLPENCELDLKRDPRLEYFVQDFVLQDPVAPADIFIKNIHLVSCLEIPQDNMAGYRVFITAKGGNTFYGNYAGSKKALSVQMYLNGKVTAVDNFECYWFKENVSVGTASELYNNFGGIGWEILNDKTLVDKTAGGDAGYRYVTNNYSYIVDGEHFLTDTLYKCVLVKDGISYEGTTQIRIRDAAVEMYLTTQKDSNVFVENVGTAEITITYIDSRAITPSDIIVQCAWQRFDKFGNEIKDDVFDPANDKYTLMKTGETEDGHSIYKGTISLEVAKIDEKNTIKCGVFNIYSKSNVTQYVGTRTIILATMKEVAFQIDLVNGSKMYKYDADGDSPCVADYDGPASSQIKTISPISFRLFHTEGTQNEFTEIEYQTTTVTWLVPQESMIIINKALQTDGVSNPGYWTITGSYNTLKSLTYQIAAVYDKNKTDNTIILKVKLKNDEVSAKTSLQFLKDGASGTNGSKYTAVITYNGYGYEEKDANKIPYKLQLYYVYDQKSWFSYNPSKGIFTKLNPLTDVVARLEVQLYSDGNIVQNPVVEWSLFDNSSDTGVRYGNTASPIKIDQNGQIFILDRSDWIDQSYTYLAVIKAMVLGTKSEYQTTTKYNEEYVFAYYPIETVYVEKFDYLKSVIPEISGGFSQVLYSSDGHKPQYDSSHPFKIGSYLHSADINLLYDYIWAGSELLEVVSSDNDTCKIAPSTQLANGINKNYVRVSVVPNDGTENNVKMKKDKLSSDIQTAENELSYYLLLDENMEVLYDFDYNNLLDIANSYKDAFELKSNLTDTANKMRDDITKNIINPLAKMGLGNVIDYIKNNTIDNVDSLIDSCGKLGMVAGASISKPSNYLIGNLPNNMTVPTYIKTAIDNYNYYVNNTYGQYYSQYNNHQDWFSNMKTDLAGALTSYRDDPRWTALTKSYYQNN